MIDKYIKEKQIEYSSVDASGYLSVLAMMNMIQDCSTEFLGKLGSSNDILKEEDDAAWIITKSVIKVDNCPYWSQKIRLTMSAYEIGKIRLGLQTKAINEDGSVAFIGLQELCAIDLSARRIRKIEEVHFPKDLPSYEQELDYKFAKIKNQFTDADMVKDIQVSWIDTDFTQHTNNASYIRYVLEAFSTKELQEKKIDTLEIHYVSESLVDDSLAIYRVDEADHTLLYLRKDETDVVKVRIRFFQSNPY